MHSSVMHGKHPSTSAYIMDRLSSLIGSVHTRMGITSCVLRMCLFILMNSGYKYVDVAPWPLIGTC